MASGLFLWLLALLVPAETEICVDPKPGATFELALAGPSTAVSGEFRGKVFFNGSPAGLPIAGRAEADSGRLRVTASARYLDVPPDWLERFRPGSFEYAIQGEVAGAIVSWSGEMPWSGVEVAGHSLVNRFLNVWVLELTNLTETRTAGRGVMTVENPFAFPVTIMGPDYSVSVNGANLGDGRAGLRTIKPKKKKGIDLPFGSDKRTFRAAAGGNWFVGAPVAGVITGTVTVRLPSGDFPFPVSYSLPMGTDGARSGVDAYPPGASSLSPR